MEELRREFEALQQRWEADHRQLVRLEASSGDRTHVVVQRERKILRFSGSPDQQVADWVEEARACLDVHGLDGAAAANFVLSNLEGAARIEIKCRPAGEREDVEKLFRALEEVYGDTLTSSQLLRQFYERHQGERESMSDLSHALVLLLDRLHSVDSTAVRNKDRMLREQFLENVRSVNLRWDLKRRVEQDPETTFLAVRKVAMFWAREVENEPAPKTQVRISQQEAVTDCRGAEASMREVVEGLAATQKVLTDNMALQQTTMTQIMNQQRELLEAVSQQPRRREPYNNSSNNNYECYFCHRKGHFKRDCLAFKNARHNNSGNGREPL